MQFRKFGKLDWKASVLGFGCMRLPTTDGNPHGPNIQEAEAMRMIRHALDRGVNYFDTAYVYHEGHSETVLGKALRGHRDRAKIATKCPVWAIQNEADFDRILGEQLSRLQTDHIDFYLLHALNKSRWNEIVLKQNLLEKAGAAMGDGRIRHLGFSFHDNYESFPDIVNGFDHWTFCQIQYIEIYNEAFLHEDIPGARFKYQIFVPEAARAGACIACHDCEEDCPQKIPISEWMPKVHALLGASGGQGR